jgi:hypothetical protein
LQEGIFLGQLFNEISRITINAVIIFAIWKLAPQKTLVKKNIQHAFVITRNKVVLTVFIYTRTRMNFKINNKDFVFSVGVFTKDSV